MANAVLSFNPTLTEEDFVVPNDFMDEDPCDCFADHLEHEEEQVYSSWNALEEASMDIDDGMIAGPSSQPF